MDFYIAFIVSCLPLVSANEAPIQKFISGNNLFATSLYNEITIDQKGNFLVSPLSVETVLALTQCGAKDETGEEIRAALYLPESQEDIENAVRTIQPLLRKNDTYTLQSVNKIYINNYYEVKDEFYRVAAVFDSELENIDFEDSHAAADTINWWVEDRTNRKIRNLIHENDLDRNTRVVLVNALYFKAGWLYPLSKYTTTKKDFYTGEGRKVQVDTMTHVREQNYYESQELDAKILELPFTGGEVTLTVVLPNLKSCLCDIENRLEEVLEKPSYSRKEVKVSLPKFRIESSVDLKKILRQLGVNKVFEDADLSGIAGEKGDLAVDEVRQKAFIDVGEGGVEAAAAAANTALISVSARIPYEPPKEFIADHPFIFYIKLKDLVIFIGRVVDPSQ